MMPGPRMIAEQGLELRPHPVARDDVVADVGAVEPGDDHPVLGNAELGEDVGAGAAVGGGGQRQPGDIAEAVEQGPQQAIVGAEVVAPFADAMRLVDREQGDLGFLQQLREAFAAGAFGGDVEQVELAIAERIANGAGVFAAGWSKRRRGCRTPRPSGPGRASARSAAR